MWSGFADIFQSIFSNHYENRKYPACDNSGYDNCIYDDLYNYFYNDFYDDETYNGTNDVTNKGKKTDNVTFKVTNDITNKQRKINKANYKVLNDAIKKEIEFEDKQKRDKQEQSSIFKCNGCSRRSPRFVKVPSYLVPKSYWSVFQEASEKLFRDKKELSYFRKELPISSHLNFKNYNEKFHSLLFIEEMHQTTEYEMYDIQETYLTRKSQYLCLKFKGINEKNITVGSSVKVHYPCRKNSSPYKGIIDEISEDIIFITFSSDFHKKYNGEKISVKFIYSRTTMQKCHFGIDLASERLGKQILFPKKISINPNKFEIKKNYLFNKNSTDTELILSNSNNLSNNLKLNWFNKNLNEVQKNAIVNVLSGATKPLPYIIFGPPGTGKTVTLVEMVSQIVTLFPKSKILIATPSNSAANLLTQRLIDSKNFNPGLLIRLVSLSHVSNENFPNHLKRYSANLSMSSKISNIPSSDIRQKCVMCIDQYRIVISTIGCLSSFMKIKHSAGRFSHVIIDEAGQATEPDTVIPLGLIDKYEGQIILAGDPMQLGPAVFSNVAKNLGLGISFLERLLTCSPYRKDHIRHGDENGGYDPCLVTKLKYNYRSIQSIIDFSSNTFYDSGIISMLDLKSKEVQLDVRRLSKTFEMKENKYTSMIFHCVKGSNLKVDENPSLFNPEEASLVLSYLHKLYKGKYTAKDIGIITPYIQQVNYIHYLIKKSNIECPQIGSVEAFQGQEKKIIILSVVKSRSNISHNAYKAISFVKEPKRLNVALTRAQILLITIGNPYLLCLDELWCNLIKHIVSSGGYIGCRLLIELVNDEYKTSDKTALTKPYRQNCPDKTAQSQTKQHNVDQTIQTLTAHYDLGETAQYDSDKSTQYNPNNTAPAKPPRFYPANRRNRYNKTAQNQTAQNQIAENQTALCEPGKIARYNPEKIAPTKPPSSTPDKTEQNIIAPIKLLSSTSDKTEKNLTAPTKQLSSTKAKTCKKKNPPGNTVQSQTEQNHLNLTAQYNSDKTAPIKPPSSTSDLIVQYKSDKTAPTEPPTSTPDNTEQNLIAPTKPLSSTTAKTCKKKNRSGNTIQSQTAQNHLDLTAQYNSDKTAPTKPASSSPDLIVQYKPIIIYNKKNRPGYTIQSQTAQNHLNLTAQNHLNLTAEYNSNKTAPIKRSSSTPDLTTQCNHDKTAPTEPYTSTPDEIEQNLTATTKPPSSTPDKTEQNLTALTKQLSSTTAKTCKKKKRRKNRPNNTVQSQTALNHLDLTAQYNPDKTAPTEPPTSTPDKTEPKLIAPTKPPSSIKDKTKQNPIAPTKPLSSTTAKTCKKKNRPGNTIQSQTAQNHLDLTAQYNSDKTAPTKPPSSTSDLIVQYKSDKTAPTEPPTSTPDNTEQNLIAPTKPLSSTSDKTEQNLSAPTKPLSSTPDKNEQNLIARTKPLNSTMAKTFNKKNRPGNAIQNQTAQNHLDLTAQYDSDKTAPTKPPSSTPDLTTQCNHDKTAPTEPSTSTPDEIEQNLTVSTKPPTSTPDQTEHNLTAPTKPLSSTTAKTCKKKKRRKNRPDNTVQSQTVQNHLDKTAQYNPDKTSPTEPPTSTPDKTEPNLIAPTKPPTSTPDKTEHNLTAPTKPLSSTPDKTEQNLTAPTKPLNSTTAKTCKKKNRPDITVKSQTAQNHIDQTAPTKPLSSTTAKTCKKKKRQKNRPNITVQSQTVQNHLDKTAPTKPF